MPAASDLLMWLTFAIIVVMVVAYALERYPMEIVAIGSLVCWLALFWLVPLLTGTTSPLGPDEILAGFSNQALVTVLALLVVGQGLYHTDALDAHRLFWPVSAGAVASPASSSSSSLRC